MKMMILIFNMRSGTICALDGLQIDPEILFLKFMLICFFKFEELEILDLT